MSTPQRQPSHEIATQSTPNRVNQPATSSSAQVQDLGAQNQGRIVGRSDKVSSLNTLSESLMSPNPPPETLLPAFPSRQHSHLPTPQSPHNIGQYVVGIPFTPESPVPHGPHTSYTPLVPASYGPLLASQRSVEEQPVRSPSRSQQILTPESSPFIPRMTSPRYNSTATPRFNPLAPSIETSTSRAIASNVKLESPISNLALAPAHRISSPLSSTSPDPPTRSTLSSPFMTKLSIADRTKSKTPILAHKSPGNSDPRPMQIDDVFSSTTSKPNPSMSNSMSTPPSSPPLDPTAIAGGEMERLRLATIQDKMAQFHEAESRRPEYLKRAKRTLADADPSALVEDDQKERERALTIGIMESPNKGRRLKLFQETSEESFEESLMAGGYGRYRTADWVRQPQPLMTPGPAGPSTIISLLESEAAPTEKELKKRKRLAAFRGESATTSGPTAKLFPVHLEGRGRVLLDVPNEGQHVLAVPEPTPAKKRGGNRRKKKGAEPTAKEKKALALAAAVAEEMVDRPNWPDSEFPWRLRTEERAELAKAEDEERMWWIEKFLDRDTDEEDEGEEDGASDGEGKDVETLSSAKWGLVYEDEGDRPIPSRRGRGKMVPLSANPNAVGNGATGREKSAFFPSDPADARAALLSKKSVRALSYHQQKRQRETEKDGDEEVVCICNSRDDGRPLVMCDGCRTWYHLRCIGIRSIAELGREEDPWFCDGCVAEAETSLPELDVEMTSSEPTFVPTDDEPRASRSYDAPFFQAPPLQDSPVTAWGTSRMPKTPTRGGGGSGDFGSGFSSASASSWVDSPRHGPSTPHYLSKDVKVYTKYTNTPPRPHDGYSYNYDESPFDPTSTPSRGIKFGVPFATPKNNLWSSRANGLFQTPSKPGRALPSGRPLGGTGSLSSALEDSGGGNSGGLGFSPFRSMPSYDDSPIRRTKEELRSRRLVEASMTSSPMSLLPHPSLEESPIMRSKGKERPQDNSRGDIGVPSDEQRRS